MEDANSNYQLSSDSCAHLADAVKGTTTFFHQDHLNCRKVTIGAFKDAKAEKHTASFEDILKCLPTPKEKDAPLDRTLRRATQTGNWLTILPSRVNGTELGRDEFRDALRRRYGYELTNLPDTCDGCGAKFSLEHASTCKSGGLIIQRHDEISQELASLSALALKPSSVRAEPLINPTGRRTAKTQQTDEEKTAKPSSDPVELNRDQGDLLIRGLWKPSTDCIIDVRCTDLDCKSHFK